MTVWIVNQYAVAPSEPGGLRPFALAKELSLAGHDVTIVASSFNHWTRSETRLRDGEDAKVETVDGVRFVWLRAPGYPGSTALRFWSMLAFAKNVFKSAVLRSFGPPDVIVGSNPHLFAAFAALKLAEDVDAAFVFEVRDIWPQSLIDLGRMSPSHPVVRTMSWMERRLVRGSGAIVTLPPTGAEYYVEKGLTSDALFWVPNGVYLRDLPDATPVPSNTLFTVLFAGIHGIANGLDTVLDAAKLLEDQGYGDKILFRLLGDGGEKPRLVERARALGLRNVLFSDPVAKSQVPDEVAKADAGLLILKRSPVFRWGVSPNKLFDYMGAGRPVIYAVEASNNPVEEAQAGVTVRADDPASLAQGAVRLYETPIAERQAMGTNAREYVEQRHDLAKLGHVLEAALSRAVTSKERARTP
ncbi:MAG: glycosyltransferase family 4 protein [Armatimonadetes bacterium]|nr:glycosyltransferase family 4 protein [Armatimonadota bacterium]